MIEQLWFGWSETGLEGSNRQQIIAASPGLADPTAVFTRTVLRYCYSPSEPTVGWCEADGIRMVFRRTPRGLDGRGRPGNYFVHALAAQQDQLHPVQLSAVLADQLLRSEAPTAAQTALAVLTIDAPPPRLPVEASRGRHALGHYLANLNAGRLTALRAEPTEVAALAAYVAQHIPESLGLVGFSEREATDASTQYDLTAAPAPNPLFADADPDVEPPPLWLSAVELLIDAAGGNQNATDCVSVLAATRASRRDFVVALGNWCAIERGDPEAVTASALRWLDGEPALRRRAMRLPVFDIVVSRAIGGDSTAGAVLEHSYQLHPTSVVDHVSAALNGTLAGGLSGLLAAGARSVTQAVIDAVCRREIDLSMLPLDNQRALLSLFGAERHVTRPVACLLSNRELATSIVGDPSWPLDWQVRAARLHAGRLTTEPVRRLLSLWPDSSALLCELPTPAPLLDLLSNAINGLDLAQAIRMREAARHRVPTQIDRAWWLTIHQQLGPLDRLQLLARSERDGGHGTACLAAPDCVDAIGACAAQGYELPQPDELYRVLGLREPSLVSKSLRNACFAIYQVNPYRSRMPGLAPAIDAIREVPEDMSRSAMAELLIWRLLESRYDEDFAHAISQIRNTLEVPAATGPRLWRGARVVARRNPKAVAHLIAWNAWILDLEPPETVWVPEPAQVRKLAEEARVSVQEVVAQALLRPRGKTARRWLTALVPTRKRGMSRPR